MRNIRKLLSETRVLLGLSEDQEVVQSPCCGAATYAKDGRLICGVCQNDVGAEPKDEQPETAPKPEAEKETEKAEAIHRSKRTVKEDGKEDEEEGEKEGEKEQPEKDDSDALNEMLQEIRDFNPFAVCKAAAKKNGWAKDKTERCIKDAKKQTGAVYEAIRQCRHQIRRIISEA